MVPRELLGDSPAADDVDRRPIVNRAGNADSRRIIIASFPGDIFDKADVVKEANFRCAENYASNLERQKVVGKPFRRLGLTDVCQN
jgi:hypothetical protein